MEWPLPTELQSVLTAGHLPQIPLKVRFKAHWEYHRLTAKKTSKRKSAASRTSWKTFSKEGTKKTTKFRMRPLERIKIKRMNLRLRTEEFSTSMIVRETHSWPLSSPTTLEPPSTRSGAFSRYRSCFSSKGCPTSTSCCRPSWIRFHWWARCTRFQHIYH